MTSPSGSSGILVVVDGPYVVCERFEIILPLPMGDGVSWAVLERSGKEVHPSPPLRTGSANYGASG